MQLGKRARNADLHPLAVARVKRKLTVVELAEKLEMSPATISHIENKRHGPHGPRRATLVAIAKELRVPVEAIWPSQNGHRAKR